jgi:type IX secretion system PorP/SprF family membrane protein
MVALFRHNIHLSSNHHKHLTNMPFRILYILFFCLIIAAKTTAQDAHFSQFYAAPQQVNPAMIGLFSGQYRVSVNYRDQWASVLNNNPFRTAGAGMDFRFRVADDDFVGAGIWLMQDEAGDARFAQSKGVIGGSYMKQLSGNRYRSSDQYLIGGAQFGFGQNRILNNNFWYSKQFDQTTYTVNKDLPSGETNLAQTTPLYMDFNAGLMWYSVFDDAKSMYVGGSIYHLLQPNVTFKDGGSSPLYMRWTGQVGGQVPMNESLSFLPVLLVMGQGKSLMANFGSNFRYTNNEESELALRAGIWGRLANKLERSVNLDAIIFTAALEKDRWQLGLSYDINTSSLQRASNNRGAFEVSFIYIHPENRRVNVNCPKF